MNASFEVKVPSENVNDTFAKLVEWCVRPGQAVSTGEVICRLETTKAVFEVASPFDGVVDYEHAPGAELPTGSTLCWLRPEGSAKTEHPAAAQPVHDGGDRLRPDGSRASGPPPAATVFSNKAESLRRRFSLGVELFQDLVVVREADVRKKAEELGLLSPDAEDSAAPRVVGPCGLEDDSRFASVEPLERSKLWENRVLAATDSSALRSTLHYWCPAPDFAAACVACTPSSSRLAVVVREVAHCLGQHPRLNATMRDDRMCLYRDVNVGFAIDMGRGLKVLTLRNVDRLSLEDVVENIDDLMVKYATDTLLPADVTGSTFTVTDLGADGIFAFIPLLNAEQSAILGLGSESTLVGTSGFMLSCSFDHRMLGGKQVADFLNDLSSRLVAFTAGMDRISEEPCCSRCLRTIADIRRLEGYLLAAEEPKGFICSLCLGGT